ncbi:hypothetical protein [Streptomyces sp. PTY087I2]|uniref:hypothetical protein n=1 Tax=Streptomyces sp. PTY087I2 TaxID=1819298 RepID=UPI000827BB21|nr:hypothetical protein [Streptomyces sp. PTY087I2]OCC09079.1 hypothetical protein A3Q37_05100 [Streptomyces sp. PTY087I2]
MALRLLCKDPESPNNGSPTLYYDDSSGTYLFQSWKVLDTERLSGIVVPEHETVIEFPERLLALFPQPASRREAGQCLCGGAPADSGEPGPGQP